jgi:integrase
MSDKLVQILREHLVSQELEALGNGQPKPIWLFTNDAGQRLDPDNVRKRVFYRLLEKAQIRRIRIHDLRHTYATRLVSNNESLAYVRDQLGHSSIQVSVDLYSHYVPGSNRQELTDWMRR